jgi:hypothetical protein
VVPLKALLDLKSIKSALSSDDDSVVQVLSDPAAATANPDSLLFTLTGWDKTSLNDILARFGSNIADLAHFDTFRRVYRAFEPVQTLGIPAAALIEATTNDPDVAGPIVRDFQSALRARSAASDWRNLIQPVNGQLRSLQRDALVAYVLQKLRESGGSTVDTADKLYEYFLMDVQMEPCMQTSRIRHALSSVQLFIDRCLLNLEPDVSPGALNADYWKWMKRYRVWEANRKVFLFPENWLEPELRDNKSPFFKEIESELVQSDITEDTAASAMLNYLSKLHDVAKLEPCGLFVEQNGVTADDDRVHVIARTSDVHRKYYYRRYEVGTWTAWEEIKVAIEDNPVVPVVWNNRLLLFWVKILKQTPLSMATPPKPANSDSKFPDLTLNLVKQDAKASADNNLVTVQAVLCWSEYYNGKWQPAKSSDLNAPASLGQFPPVGAGAFDRSSLRLWSDEPQPGQLRISINGNVQRAGFLLYNTHGLPVSATAMPLAFPFGYAWWFETAGATFPAVYGDRTPEVPPESVSREMITRNTVIQAVAPCHHLSDAWDAPFFLEDRRNVFYVTTHEEPVWISNYRGFGVAIAPGIRAAEQMAPLVVQIGPPIPPKYWGDGGPIGQNPSAVDPAPITRYITEDAYIRQGLATSASVQYGDVQIGPSGALANTNVANKISGGN